MTQIWSLFTDRIGKINLKIHSDLMSDRRNVQHTVRRNISQCHTAVIFFRIASFCSYTPGRIFFVSVPSPAFPHVLQAAVWQIYTAGIIPFPFSPVQAPLSDSLQLLACVHARAGTTVGQCLFQIHTHLPQKVCLLHRSQSASNILERLVLLPLNRPADIGPPRQNVGNIHTAAAITSRKDLSQFGIITRKADAP